MGKICSTASPPKNKANFSVAFSQEYKGIFFECINSDILDAESEAIICSANQQLIHDSSFGTALIAKGGQTIEEESEIIRERYKNKIPIGTAVVTSAGNLRAKFIIHVISPIWSGGSKNEERKLAECVINALAQVERLRIQTIAISAFDAGVFGFPVELAARIMIKQCMQYIDAQQSTSIKNVTFINNNAVTVSAFRTALQSSLLKPLITDEEIAQRNQEKQVDYPNETDLEERRREFLEKKNEGKQSNSLDFRKLYLKGRTRFVQGKTDETEEETKIDEDQEKQLNTFDSSNSNLKESIGIFKEKENESQFQEEIMITGTLAASYVEVI